MPGVLIGDLHTEVVGCSHYTATQPRSGGVALSFKRNPDNPYDENAIAVHNGAACTKKTHIGHLPRDVAKMLAAWMDKGVLALTGVSAGPCDGYTVPAVVACVAEQGHAQTLQKWLARVAYGFEPAEIAPPAQQAAVPAAGVKRERTVATKQEQAAGGTDKRQAKSAKLKRSSQELEAPALASQPEEEFGPASQEEDLEEEDGAPAEPAVNLLPANIELSSKQVFHGQVWLCFDEKGAATISGVEDTLLEGVLRTWPVLRRKHGKAGRWVSPPLDDLERYFLARTLQHMAPLADGKCMRAPYPLDLIIPLRFRPCAKDGTPLVGPMIAAGGRPQNSGRQYFAARGANTPDGGRWIWADGSVPKLSR